jgi:hypothetical protein
MTHYATCFNCVNDKFTCQRRINLRDALKGSNVYSVKFKCPERRAFFTSGQRVAFDWKSFDSDGYDESCLNLTFTGVQIIVDRAPLIRPERQDIKTAIAFGILVAMLAFGGAHVLNHLENQYAQEARV